MGALLLVCTLGAAAWAGEPFEVDSPPELQASDPGGLADAGRRYLDEGRLGHAVDVLSYALHVDPTPSTHLLMARALAAIRVRHPHEACAWGAFVDTILAHVQIAVEGGATGPAELAELPDVQAALSGSLAYRVLLDRKALRGRRAMVSLVAVQWHHADGRQLAFRDDGTAVTVRWTVDADRAQHPVYQRGKWSLKKGILTLSLHGVAPTALTLDERGLGPWTGWSPDCPTRVDVWRGH